MDKIDKTTEAVLSALATNSTTSQDGTSNKTGLPISWISALFKKFQAIYGHKWVISIEGIEETAVTEWSQGLAGLSGEDVKRGIDNLHDEWPPSLPVFRALCKGKSVNGFGLDYVPEYHRPAIRNPERILSSDKRDANRKKVASKAMADIRSILGKGKK